MKKFEIPYNFANDYCEKIKELKVEYFDYIKFVYMPAFKENDIKNTRETDRDEGFRKYKKMDFLTYCTKVKELQNLGLEVAILMQMNATMELVEKYINELHIKYFFINDDELAKQLKDKYGKKIHLILSITRVITEEEILNNDFSMYDEITLYFWFNRHLDSIKKLPKKYKYVIMLNNYCAYNCKIARIDWFDGENFKGCNQITPDNNIYINPNDMIYFDKYINTFKLVDRIMPTDIIINDIKYYIDAYKKLDTFEFDTEREKHYNVED